MKKTLPFLVFLILLSGCASIIGTPIDTSQGANDKATLFPAIYTESRFLKPTRNHVVVITSVDGKDLPRDSIWTSGVKAHPVYVAPGKHIIKVIVNRPSDAPITMLGDSKFADTTSGELSIDVSQNKSYLVSAEMTDYTGALFAKVPTKYKYSIGEFSGSESPELDLIFKD